MVGISVFFHRDRDLDAGVSVQLLFLEFLDRLLIFRRDRLVGEVVAVEFFIQLLASPGCREILFRAVQTP